MQAQQVNQPNQEAQMPENQKTFADLLITMMDVVEKYQEGENGEGNYLTAMNALRDLHKYKQQLATGSGRVVYQYYQQVARAPAPPPARARAARKKLCDEEKRAAGYVECSKCGRLFSENSKLRRHQETTEICRHISHEKEVAVQTKRVERVKADKKPRGASAVIMPPDDHCISKKHAYYGSFVHSMLLFLEGKKHHMQTIWARHESALTAKKNATPCNLLITPQHTGFEVRKMRTDFEMNLRKTLAKENFYDAYMHSIMFETGETLPHLNMDMSMQSAAAAPPAPASPTIRGSMSVLVNLVDLYDQAWSHTPDMSPREPTQEEMDAFDQQIGAQGGNYSPPEHSPTGSPPLSPPLPEPTHLFADYESD